MDKPIIIGNLLTQIEEFIENDTSFPSGIMYDNPAFAGIESKMRELTRNAGINKHWRSASYSSVPKDASSSHNDCGLWHTDMYSKEAAVLVAYPTPTEILPICRDFNVACSYGDAPVNNKGGFNAEIDWLIEHDFIRPIEHDIGDVVFMPAGCIHRRSPNCSGENHYVFRLWEVL